MNGLEKAIKKAGNASNLAALLGMTMTVVAGLKMSMSGLLLWRIGYQKTR